MPIQEIAGAYQIDGDDVMGDTDSMMGAMQIMGGDELSGAAGPSLGHSLPNPMLKKDKLDQGRRIPLGLGFFADGAFPPTPAPGASGPSVLAFAPLQVIVRPQILFRLERLLIPSDIAGNFVINDVLIGTQSIFAGVDAVPARVFDETATNTLLGTATNQPATHLTVKVQNFTALPSPFSGAFIGIAVI